MFRPWTSYVYLYERGELVERSRFRDLMQILNDIDGVQPHRSYWVPTHAILHLEGDADRLNIVLTSRQNRRGAHAPQRDRRVGQGKKPAYPCFGLGLSHQNWIKRIFR